MYMSRKVSEEKKNRYRILLYKIDDIDSQLFTFTFEVSNSVFVFLNTSDVGSLQFH